jgi:hypothetical protein
MAGKIWRMSALGPHASDRLPMRCYAMDRAVIIACIRDELAHAKHFAGMGRTHVERQRQIIAKFERDDPDTVTDTAKALLTTLEQTQALHEASVERLEEELAAFQTDYAIDALSRNELRWYMHAQKSANAILASGAEAVAGSRSLLNRLPEKP